MRAVTPWEREHLQDPPDFSGRRCTVPGCDKPLECRGMCPMHYTRWRKFGDVEALTHTPRRDPSEHFWRRVDGSDPSACWEWTGSRGTGGYGSFSYWDGVRPRTMLAHRFAYEDRVGPIPEGLHLDHLCRVRACVNPAHLEPVTPAENTRRGVEVRTHCIHGHPLSGENLGTNSATGNRFCRECARAAKRRYEAKRVAS